MAYSSQFRTLRSRLTELRKRFLPGRFSKTGAYSVEQLDGARAYRVLSHAEIEHYLETRVLELAESARDAWITSRRQSRTITQLFLCHGRDLGAVGDAKVDLSLIAGTVFARFRHVVKNNHGVKIKHVRELMLPVGLEEGDLDTAWLSTLESFGARRGDAAHATAVSYSIDPKSDFDTVTLILEGVKQLDAQLNLLKSACT